MNIYGWIILIALLAEFGLDLIANGLNLKALSGEIPDEFKDVLEKEKYQKSQEYTRVNTRFGLLGSAFDLIVLLIFWLAGGFNFVDGLIRGLGLHPIINGIFYIGVLFLVKGVLTLPFSIYSTFVIEERFGFNRTTVKTYILDIIKALALGLLLGMPLLAGVLAFFQYTGQWAWIICWGVATLYTLMIEYIAPVWLMPLFNKFEPLEEGPLRKAIFDYAESVNYPVGDVSVMDGSRRSAKSNAFFTGFGKHRRIALFDTLIEQQSVQELVAVLAHEIGHYKKKHVMIGIGITIMHTGILFFLLSIFLTQAGLFEAFFMQEQSNYAGLLFFALLYTPIEMLLGPLMAALSRHHERQADRYAVETVGSGNDLISGLKKLSIHNLSNLRPHPFYVFLNYSHPPLVERIKLLKSITANLS